MTSRSWGGSDHGGLGGSEEIGHALGVRDRTQTSSCMSPCVTDQRYPDAIDSKDLSTRYGYR